MAHVRPSLPSALIDAFALATTRQTQRLIVGIRYDQCLRSL
jgi:hypothetical protein